MNWRYVFVCLFSFATCLAPGCLSIRSRSVLPVKNSIIRDQLVVYSNVDIPRRHRLINDLVALRGDLAEKLRLPMSEEPIHVYLFDSKRRYREFMEKHYPLFSDRRAFFVQRDTTLTVYAFWGDRVAEDLRHEVAHGYLHSVIQNLPLWLDEGLAEYFEVPRGSQGVNLAHVDYLMRKYRRDEWTPDIRRLERLVKAESMTQLDYAEAWLWVHFLLDSTPERLLIIQDIVAQLRKTGSVGFVATRIEEIETSPERSLVRHLKTLNVE